MANNQETTMKMKIHIAAIATGILAAGLLAGGCGKFVRDELVYMQNEMDAMHDEIKLLQEQVDQANQGLKTLHDIVDVMAADGYITKVEKFEDETGEGYILSFRTVTVDENGNVSSDDSSSIKLYSGKDGQDADPYVVSMKQNEEDGRWYWYSTQDEDWLKDADGNPFLVDGKTPQLKVEDGYWFISWDGKADDDETKTWEETGWKAKGEDAYEWFSKAEVFDDRVELTLASDGSVIVLPRFLPVEVALTLGDQSLEGDVMIAPGETVSIKYVLSGTGAENAVLVAGTDGRMKTALRPESATEGTVDVTCPAEFPEGGYVYITVNDGNGRSDVRVIRFVLRKFKLLYGDAEYAAPAAGTTGQTLTFEANFDLDAACVFPEGVEPWLTAKLETVEGVPVLTYDVAANTAAEAREGVIVVSPKDHPGFEVFRVTVKQAAAETGSGETGSGE